MPLLDLTAPPAPEELELMLTLFDGPFYVALNPDVSDSGSDPFLHFLEHGAFEGRSPHPLFDTAFYVARHPELIDSGVNPLLHFLRIGARTGADPHPLFDTRYYLSQHPELDGRVNPLVHFIKRGGPEGRNPHPMFDTAFYLEANEDVRGSSVNPLVHYVRWGAVEGRVPSATAPGWGLARGRPPGYPATRLCLELARRDSATKPAGGLSRRARTSGLLATCLDPRYQDRMFYCLDGKRHHARPDRLACYALSLDDLCTVASDELQRYQLAGPLPLLWPDVAWSDPIRSCPQDLHEIATSRLRGSGIEFGAGARPTPVPLDCNVKYADLRSPAARDLDLVSLTCVMGMEDMSAIPDASLDFVIASHVIEHLRNPLRAFEQVYRKLRPGGQYVLIVPDQRLMFDRNRALTTIPHLLEDFERPSADRDIQHYWEFFRRVYEFEGEELDRRVHEAISANLDLHFHTWTYESFGDMVEHMKVAVAPWRSVWSQPAIWEDPGSQEFYFVLEK